MKIGILGTGAVGNTIGTKLVQLGHEVKMGSRTATNEKAVAWVTATGNGASAGNFADSAAFGDILFNCTSGKASLLALEAAGAANMKGKTLLDVSNPLDFSKGMPPSLTVSNTDSLGEQIQRAFPETKVVKTLNTMNCKVMVNPGGVNGGDHHVFVCGNEHSAKTDAKNMLKQFGWKEEHILDLGDITGARGLEQILPLWVRIMGTFGNANFQFKIVK